MIAPPRYTTVALWGDGASWSRRVYEQVSAKDEEGTAKEVVTSLWFVAFGGMGEAIAQHARKGDQLVLEARVRASNWTDEQGEKQYDHSFIVQGFRFGAPGKLKREELDARRGTEGRGGTAHAVNER